ncbi:MAG: hypothetical protein ACK5JH_03085, partial [Anaerocolumna sp.]
QEWQGEKTALFKVNGTTYPVLVEEDNTCTIPEECYFSRNLFFEVGVICCDLITTNLARVNYSESCYTPNVSIPVPTEDVYTQIINRLNEIDSSVATDEQIQNAVDQYFTDHPINTTSNQTSEYIAYANGSINTWIDGVKGFSVPSTNVYVSVPMVFADAINVNNANLASYYGTISSEGVVLTDDISQKVDKIEFNGSIKLLENQWYSTEYRLIAHAPECESSMYLGEEYNFDKDLCIELGTFGVPLGGKRSSDFNPRPFFTSIKYGTGEIATRDGWILKLQMKSDSTQDIITNRSYVLLTFCDK